MKTIRNILFVLLATTTVQVIANPSVWSGDPKRSIWNHWSIALNGGYTSYFGDLSIYDSDPVNKLKHESKPAFGVLLSKYFSDDLALSGQLFYGGLKGQYNEKLSFDTDFLEYNVQLRVDLFNLILRNNNSGIGLIAFGGVGHMFFNSRKYALEKGEMKTYTHRASSPEFVYFIGGGMEYSISERYSVNIDAAVRQVQNDRIDNEVRKDNFDFYSFINVGVTYKINNLLGKNKKGNLYGRGVRMAKR